MRKYSALIMVGLFLLCAGCKPLFSDYVIDSQEDLDGIVGTTHIFGNLTITATDITDLDGLESLEYVGGTFHITGTSLMNLSGLHNLVIISGDFIVDHNLLLAGYLGKHYLLENQGLDNLTLISGGFESLNNFFITSDMAEDLVMSVENNTGLHGIWKDVTIDE